MTSVGEESCRFRRGKSATFMGLELAVGDDVVAPRSETELLAKRAMEILQDSHERQPIAIDMCCGSGNLALCLAVNSPNSLVFAADLTDAAIETARLNARRLGLDDRVMVRQGDLFSALTDDHLTGRAAMIVCNPPYISTARLEGKSAHLLEEEPREAFDGGPYGIAIHQRLVRDAAAFLRPGGHLLFEFGLGQHRQAAALLARTRCYDVAEMIADEAGEPRVAVARLASTEP